MDGWMSNIPNHPNYDISSHLTPLVPLTNTVGDDLPPTYAPFSPDYSKPLILPHNKSPKTHHKGPSPLYTPHKLPTHPPKSEERSGKLLILTSLDARMPTFLGLLPPRSPALQGKVQSS